MACDIGELSVFSRVKAQRVIGIGTVAPIVMPSSHTDWDSWLLEESSRLQADPHNRRLLQSSADSDKRVRAKLVHDLYLTVATNLHLVIVVHVLSPTRRSRVWILQRRDRAKINCPVQA